MDSIVQQLQSEALDQNCSVSQLLRKARIVAVKLELDDFNEWITNELEGYEDSEDIPDYRTIYVELKGFNPFRGWRPVIFEDPDSQRIVSERQIRQAVSGLEDLVKEPKSFYVVPLNPEARNAIMKGMDVQVEIMHFAPRPEIIKILDSVRNIILDWSLKLEKNGILGEGLNFSEKEKGIARSHTVTYQINKVDNFIGNIESTSEHGSIVISQNNNDVNALKNLIEQINFIKNHIPLEGDALSTFNKNVNEVNGELSSGKPDRAKIKSRLISIKSILENMTGSVIAQGIIVSIQKILNGGF